MKIAFVTSHLTVFGGGGKFVTDYANKFCERNHSVAVVAQKIDRKYYKFNDKISLIEIGGPLPSNPLHWLRFKKIKKSYLKVLNKLDCDIFLSQNFPSNYFCASINKEESYSHVFYCHEPFRFFHDKKFYSHSPIFLKIASWVLRRFYKKYDVEGTLTADNIICNSDFTRKRVKKFYGRDSYLHYNGVEINENTEESSDFNLYQELMLKRKIPIIFTLGLSHHLKGARELMYIFDKILKEITDIILLIGGLIKKENEIIIKKWIKKLKIPPKNIIFYGFIEANLLKYFYAQSTLTFYNAIDEAYGLIPLESMKNGTPVIAFEGGPTETIRDGKTGYIIKNYKLNEFAQKAIKLIKNKILIENFSKKCKEHVKKNFNFEKSFSSLEKILQEIVSRK